jgi:methyl-accepting chemotaxis protein
MFKNMKLSTKIMAALSSIIIGMLIVAGTAYNGIHTLSEEVKEISEYELPLLESIVEIEKDVLKQEVLTLELILAAKDVQSKEFNHIEQEISKLEEITEKHIRACQTLAKKATDHASDAKIKKQYSHIYDLCKGIEAEQQVFEKNLKKFEHDLETANLDNIDNDQKSLFKELETMNQEAEELIHKMNKLTHDLSVKSEQEAAGIILMVEIISGLFFLIAVFIAFAMNKDIKRNINDFQEGLLGFFRYLNRDASDASLLDESSSDEIGTMAKVVNINIMRTKTEIENDKQVIAESVSVLSEFEQGDLCQRVTGTTTNPVLQELTTLLNQMGTKVESNIDNALNVLEQYASHNYTDKVETRDIKEHLLKLANGVNTLGDSISNLLRENLSKGVQMQANSSELTMNVSKLSSSSNQQAASLEETAAALEEITSTMVANGENIATMASLANDLSIAVTTGEQLANKTSTSMNEIDEKVTSINDAITIIDQIAFQTNILSLNAAVEAATAGEAGKGFAVVAQEVRNLASRSADAANEIKSLVSDATTKADEGKVISNRMIVGYNNLHDIISSTVGLISDVTSASKEQQKGIEQINDAVSQLDKSTQENAIVASATDLIAKETNSMASDIVEEVNKSEFNGKSERTVTKSSNKPKATKAQNIPERIHAKPIKRSPNKTIKKEIVADNDSDQWESF